MIKKVCVVGGSSGLGLAITRKLKSLGHEALVISRNKPKEIDLLGVKHYPLDLGASSFEDSLSQVLNEIGRVDAFCFCQRYRPSPNNLASKFLSEYKVMVESTYTFLEFYLNHIATNQFFNTVIVGSSYSASVGFDQDASYHCVKSAQRALVAYLSIHYSRYLSINLLSPPTFMKPGSIEHWLSTDKYNLWQESIGHNLPTAEIIADSIVNFLLTINPTLSGNNIMLDHGLSNLYFDQKILNQ
jgi:NAD(P)-dependent dehydrogenase (short-subunit alcohol dehydrogenase family)